ncbi:unnamed protein product [Ambrosiozyma monospora]|uniref:Unnamed protein product n=1 Tax=Ambrosiozyma monospora TaxID=43982 RepID=A0ACB5T9I5_AMBMO|nr:unnamed protein product [Ambrosiozyma monospora]
MIRKHDSLIHQILAREIPQYVIDERIRNILNFIKFGIESGIPANGKEDEDNNTAETSAFIRQLADDAIVLLKNENSILPLKPEENICLIGPGAVERRTTGGGSASLNSYYHTSVADALKKKLGHDVPFAMGSLIAKNLHDLGEVVTNPKGKGFDVKVYKESFDVPEEKRTLLENYSIDVSNLLLFDYDPKGCENSTYYMQLEGDLTPDKTGEYSFREQCLGTAQLFIDGKLVIDDKTKQGLSSGIFASPISSPQIVNVKLNAGQKYHIKVEFGSGMTFTARKDSAALVTDSASILNFGYIFHKTDEEYIEEAVELAKKSDKVILCVGTSLDYESEGFDRSEMKLPGNQEELVSAVLKVNKNVIIVNQSGTPVSLPWIDNVPAFMQAWFNGMEAGNAIADVLYGDVNPSGKLPLSYPKRVEDNPAFLTFKSNNGQCVYGEDVFAGWKFYEKRKIAPLFPFGFGLSYTDFTIDNIATKLDGENLEATVDVTNTGKVTGKEVVQLYVVPPKTTTAVDRPLKELKGFAKVELKAGEKKTVKIEVPYKYAASYFDVDANQWHAEKGEYGVLVGDSSSSEKFLESTFTLEKDELWSGL